MPFLCLSAELPTPKIQLLDSHTAQVPKELRSFIYQSELETCNNCALLNNLPHAHKHTHTHTKATREKQLHTDECPIFIPQEAGSSVTTDATLPLYPFTTHTPTPLLFFWLYSQLVSATNAPLMHLPGGQNHHQHPPSPPLLYFFSLPSSCMTLKSLPPCEPLLPTDLFSCSSVLQREDERRKRRREEDVLSFGWFPAGLSVCAGTTSPLQTLFVFCESISKEEA